MSAGLVLVGGIASGPVFDETVVPRDLDGLRVPAAGSVVATGSKWEPYRLLDAVGSLVEPSAAFFADLLAAGRSEATIRSYGMDLLRWFRFLWSIDITWDRATRAEARDFCRWMAVAGHRRGPFSVAARMHSETVLRTFYDFHRDVGTGPILNPFPLDRSRRGGRAHAHHNPMEPYQVEKTGLYRPRPRRRIPRSIPDEQFNEIFARLPSNRDRALVAFYVSTGARASELLSATQSGVDPGRQLITVVRKGTREVQELPASSDAFVWLRLYQVEMQDAVPLGPAQPLWWTLRQTCPAADLSRRAPHVRARQHRRRCRGDTARVAAHGRLPDGRGPRDAVDRCPIRLGPRTADDHADLPDAPQGGRDRPRAGPPRRPRSTGQPTGTAGARLPTGNPRGAVRRDHAMTLATTNPTRGPGEQGHGPAPLVPNRGRVRRSPGGENAFRHGRSMPSGRPPG